MAPKRNPNQLPSACEELKHALTVGGLEVNEASIRGVERKLRQRAFSALNSVLKTTHPEKFLEYSKLALDEDRRSWLAAFLVDPASGGSCIATNSTSRTSKRKESGKG
eukprot:8657956-Pyramimonas_sp.AAC.1